MAIRLSLNASKSHFLHFCPGKLKPIDVLNFGNNSIIYTDHTKFLGIIIDENTVSLYRRNLLMVYSY